MKRRLYISVVLLMLFATLSAQQYVGLSGMIHVPTADMDTAGVARVGAHFIPKSMMPDRMTIDGEKFNSFTNYVSLTPFRWIQLSYGYTLWKMHQDRDPKKSVGFYSKDRYFSVKLQVLPEGKWWPSLAVGGNDVWGSGDGGASGSNFYRNWFVSVSKHLDFNGHSIAGHVTYRHWKRDFNHKWEGVVGGITYSPSFYKPLRVICEWDGNEVNIGADARLFKYVLIQCALSDFRFFHGGLCLYIPLL